MGEGVGKGWGQSCAWLKGGQMHRLVLELEVVRCVQGSEVSKVIMRTKDERWIEQRQKKGR